THAAYLKAGSPVRAQVVADYARMHLPEREVRDWPAAAPPRNAVEIESSERVATLEQERARAVLAVAASAARRAQRATEAAK
ncbi:MAG TPA: hypothetical protein VLW85_01085, partial [Myxococcales bacterium]|nr:hypothetical protein [Myxococcales bacterium]